MLSVHWQMALGFVPATVFFLCFSVFAKRFRVLHICATILSAAVIAIAVIGGTNAWRVSSAEASPVEDERRLEDDAGTALEVVYALAAEGELDAAWSILEEIKGEYTPAVTLCAARLSVLRSDFDAARALYRKAETVFPDSAREREMLDLVYQTDREYFGMRELSAFNEAHRNRNALLEDTVNEVTGIIDDTLNRVEKNNYAKISDILRYAETAYGDYLAGRSVDTAEVEAHLKDYRKFAKSNEAVASTLPLTRAKLQLQILSEDYGGIAEEMSDRVNHEELLVVTELYLQGHIDERDFSDEYVKDTLEQYDVVLDHLDLLAREANREDRTVIRAAVGRLREEIAAPLDSKFEAQLLHAAETGKISDASKLYLQAAKLEYSAGDIGEMWEYLNASMDYAAVCEDTAYAEPMMGLEAVITAKDDPGVLADAPEYVDQVLRAAVPIAVPEKTSADGTSASFTQSFSTQMQTYVNQKRMSVNIVSVDTTDFEKDGTVRATVNISNNLYTDKNALQAAMQVEDCGLNINGFKVEKVEYTEANFLLCVDVSGSMSGAKISALRSAIKQFAAGKAEIENIALIAFSDRIVKSYPFGTSAEELTAAAGSLGANGGTAIYGTLTEALDYFKQKPGSINSVILMTDGQDGSRASDAKLKENITQVCASRDITVYTIGFGTDADADYLSAIARAAGGEFLMAGNPDAAGHNNQLADFFDNLRAQILNQYTVTFKATDTLTYVRELEITVGDMGDMDKVTYYLGGGKDSTTITETDENSPIFMQGVAVHGCVPHQLYRGKEAPKTSLKGEGFKPEDVISIVLKGRTTNTQWKVKTEYVSEREIALELPKTVGVDVYDLYVTVNGRVAVIEKGLSIFVPGKEVFTDFGAYRFMSNMKEVDGKEITLHGNVVMNGWLAFNDSITLKGDLNGDEIKLSDTHGARVYYDPTDASGLAKTLAESGRAVELPAFGTITLYHDKRQASDMNFAVAEFRVNEIVLGPFFVIAKADSKLYPNMFSFEASSFTSDLPFAKKLIRPESAKVSVWDFKVKGGGTISSNCIGILLEAKYGASNNAPFFFGNQKFNMGAGDIEFLIDTFKNEYAIQLGVRMKFLGESKDAKQFGFRIEWNNPDRGDHLSEENHNGIVPTMIQILADFDIETTISGVPVTFSDFKIGVKDIDTSKNLFHWTLMGSTDIAAAKISTIKGMKGLEEHLGDVSAVKFDDTTLELSLGEVYIKASTAVKLLGELDIGAAEIEMGKFSYTSKLLRLNDVTEYGMRARITAGPNWKFGKSTLQAQISGELDLMSDFFGLQGEAIINARLKLWIVSLAANLNGELAIGFRRNYSNGYSFIIWARPEFKGGNPTWPKNSCGKVGGGGGAW